MIIGIDVGITGALAFLDTNQRCVGLYDMPVMVATKKRQQVNAVELAKIIKNYPLWQGSTAYVEQVSAMPGQGVSGMFSFGCSLGIVLGVLGALQIPVVMVTPQRWKKKARLIGKDKDYCRTLMQRLYPEQELSRKKDIGRADALAIARFGV